MTPGERDVLLIVDVQNDFIPSGALAVAHGDEVVPLVDRLARAFQHVILTQDWHTPGLLGVGVVGLAEWWPIRRVRRTA